MAHFSDPGVSMSRLGPSRHSDPVASCSATYTAHPSSGGRDVLVADRVDSVPVTAHGKTFTIHFVRKQRGGGESAIYSTNSDADMAAREQLIARTQAVLEKLPEAVVQRMNTFNLDVKRTRPSGGDGLNTPFNVTSFTAVNTGSVAPVNIDYSPAQAEINTLLATLVPHERVRIEAIAGRSRIAAAADAGSSDDSRPAPRVSDASRSHRSSRRRLPPGRSRRRSGSASSDRSAPRDPGRTPGYGLLGTPARRRVERKGSGSDGAFGSGDHPGVI